MQTNLEQPSIGQSLSSTENTNLNGKPGKKFHPPQLRGDQRVFFVGKTDSGKSYYARYLLKRMRDAGWRIVIGDPKKDWMGRGKELRPFSDGKKERGTIDKPVLVSQFPA